MMMNRGFLAPYDDAPPGSGPRRRLFVVRASALLRRPKALFLRRIFGLALPAEFLAFDRRPVVAMLATDFARTLALIATLARAHDQRDADGDAR